MNLLASSIREEIAAKGHLPFVEFMKRALYHPEWGYYSTRMHQFGPQGDFVTAPLLTPLFGKTLADVYCELEPSISDPIILEFGAGNGRLCVDILKALRDLKKLPKAYWILEVSGALKSAQSALIAEEIPELSHLVSWLSALPKKPFSGLVLANEVLDAMPVCRFTKYNGEIFENIVAFSPDKGFYESYHTPSKKLAASLLGKLPDVVFYQSEVNPFLNGFMKSLANVLESGVALFIDYGFLAHEYYHPDRNQGTLMCHYQQKAHSNPFIHIGEQDITAHVDFTALSDAGIQNGFQVVGYTQQASFLLGSGLLRHVQQQGVSRQVLNAVRMLIEPSEMGELFKVMAFSKNLAVTFSGFDWNEVR